MANKKKKLESMFHNLEKNIIRPTTVAPIITVNHFKGKLFEFKTPPKNVLGYAEDLCDIKWLSDPQKEVLVSVMGDDPEDWNRKYTEIVMLIGMGGGKNVISEILAGYACYFLSNLVDPYKAFSHFCQKEIPKTQHFEITNSSIVGANQAKTVFFERIKNILKATKYEGENFFTKYMSFDLREEGQGDIKQKVIDFPSFFEDSGRIILHSLDSSPAQPEGKFILLAFVDEPSRANTQKTHQEAKQLWKMVTGNTTGRFPNGVGKAIAFSYPNTSEYDLTYELVEQEKEIEADCHKRGVPYVTTTKYFVFSTYEFNPSVKPTDPDKVKKYMVDEIDSLARFDCIKSRSQFAFFKPNVEKVKECAITELQNRVNFNVITSTRSLKTGGVAEYTALQIEEIKGDNRIRAWAADTSYNKDVFVLVSGYSEELQQRDVYESLAMFDNQQTQIKIARRVVIDTAVLWRPTKKRPVDYNNVRDVVDTVLDAFPNSMTFSGDQYQVASIAAQFENRGIRTKMLSFSNPVQFRYYYTFRLGLFNNLVGYLNHPLLVEELERVQKINETKVDHPAGFSKDFADAAVILYNELITADFSMLAQGSGLDRYKDAQLIELLDKMIRYENEAKLIYCDPKKYVMEKLFIQEKEYVRLQEARGTYFPSV